MDDILYIITILALTIFILFFGGHNQQLIIEYDSEYFQNLNTITIFENQLNKNFNNIKFDLIDFIDISNNLSTASILIPNFVNCFYIQIKSYSLFNIYKIVKKKDVLNHMMIIFNHNKHNNLELLINNSTNDLYSNNNIELENMKYGYFYDLEKTISITSVNHIYNNSNENIIITCFILKKPFWFK
jgi:hypothetical protein